MEIRTNFSEKFREITNLKTTIFKDIGDSLAQGIWEEFQVLVAETAQHSGSTAASWNLSMGGDSSVRMQLKREPQEALSKGHGAAVQIALAHNFKSLLDITEKYRQAAIVVENHAPGAETAEVGPLRAVNNPAGAFERFKQRVAIKHFRPVKDYVV